jgi:pyrroloquinoline quinone (PQQ) biosynthesis protein C
MDRRSPATPDRRRSAFAGVLPFADRRACAVADRRLTDRRRDGFGHPGVAGPTAAAASPIPLDVQLERLLQEADLDAALRAAPTLVHAFSSSLAATLDAGFGRTHEGSLGEIHRALYHLYGQTFLVPESSNCRQQFHPLVTQARRKMEATWEAHLEAAVQCEVNLALASGEGFEPTLVNFCARHRLSRHPFFDFLEHEASRDNLIDFFLSDSAVVLRFFDLLALSLVGADDEVRGELVDNLWDEMGHRDPKARHNKLFLRLLRYVGLDEARIAASGHEFHHRAGWPCLAGHNLYLLLATQRRNYFRSLGCLGSAELMDAGQYAKVVRGCLRLGWNDRDGLAYYTSHAEADIEHGKGWLERVLVPLARKYPNAAREFLFGAAFRLETAAQYYDSLLATMRDAPPGGPERAEPAHGPSLPATSPSLSRMVSA